MQALQSLATIELIEKRSKPRKRKINNYKSFDPFSLTDGEFKRIYRFSKKTAAFIINLFRKDLELDTRGRGSSPELQVLTAIRCWGRIRTDNQDVEGGIHGLSQQSVSRFCQRVANAIARHARTYIKMPQTSEAQQHVIQEFSKINDFPDVLGCIDCTRVRIKKFGGDTVRNRENKKGYPQGSMNIQVTCDARYKIRDIVVSLQGNTHKSHLFNESNIKECFERGDFNGRLLGDSGYELQPYLITPLLTPRNGCEERYNEAHKAIWSSVERCVSMWKQRFQSLLYGLTVNIYNIKPTILALAVLHNIGIDQHDSVPDYDDLIMDSNDDTTRTMKNKYVNEIDIGGNVYDDHLHTFNNRHFTQ